MITKLFKFNFVCSFLFSLLISHIAMAACFTARQAEYAECTRSPSLEEDTKCNQIYSTQSKLYYADCKYEDIQTKQEEVDRLKHQLMKWSYEKKGTPSEIKNTQTSIDNLLIQIGKNLEKTEVGIKENVPADFVFSKTFWLQGTRPAFPGPANVFSGTIATKVKDKFVQFLTLNGCTNIQWSYNYDPNFGPDEFTLAVKKAKCPKNLKVNLEMKSVIGKGPDRETCNFLATAVNGEWIETTKSAVWIILEDNVVEDGTFEEFFTVTETHTRIRTFL